MHQTCRLTLFAYLKNISMEEQVQMWNYKESQSRQEKVLFACKVTIFISFYFLFILYI